MPLIVICIASSTSLSDSISYITFLFSEWRIPLLFLVFCLFFKFDVISMFVEQFTKFVKRMFQRRLKKFYKVLHKSFETSI